MAADDTVKTTGTIVAPPRQDAAAAPPELRKAVEIPTVTGPAAVQVTPAETAETVPASKDRVKPAPDGAEARKLPAPRYKRAEQPPKRNGQVAVFVSRKEKKIFVRQGFVPLFDMPIEIEDVNRPLGTHVFTALGAKEDGSGMRWNLVTVKEATAPEHRESRRRKSRYKSKPVVESPPPPTDATEALDRIRMPKEAAARIGELLVAGSSLIISDQGISYETGRGTEFIILTR
jgi:hypothetical protein